MRGRARSRLGRARLLAMVIPLAPPPRGLATSQGPLLRTEALARYFGPRNSSESLVSRLNPPVLQAGKLGLRVVAALGLMGNRTALLSRRTWVSDLNTQVSFGYPDLFGSGPRQADSFPWSPNS